MAQYWYYRVEAKGIQSYLFRTSKLREILGGSAIVHHLLDERGLLGAVLAATGGSARFEAAAAGGATLRFEEQEHLRRFVSRFPFEASRVAPGLDIVQAWVRMDESAPGLASELALRLARARNLSPLPLPQATPVVDTSPRGGGLMVSRSTLVPGPRGEKLDASLERKHWMAERAVEELASSMLQGRSADGTVLPPARPPTGARWPLDIDQIAGGESGYVAVIHADGNSIGQLVPDLTSTQLRAFSVALTEVTRAAATDAVKRALFQGMDTEFVPGRIVVLGGDDLTAVVRGDRALDFADEFLRRFTELSLLDPVLSEYTDKQGLSASAGIAWVRAHHPFIDAYHLADRLCSWAKAQGRTVGTAPGQPGPPIPALLAFQKVSDTLARSPRDQLNLGRSVAVKGAPLPARFGAGPYLVGPSANHTDALAAGMFPLRGVREIGAALASPEMPRGAFRELVRLIESEPGGADARWERIRQVQARNDGRAWRALRDLLSSMSPDLDASLWTRALRSSEGRTQHVAITPWLDAVTLSRHDGAVR